MFGCIAFVLIPVKNRKKLNYMFEKFIFFRYNEESKGYKLIKKQIDLFLFHDAVPSSFINSNVSLK